MIKFYNHFAETQAEMRKFIVHPLLKHAVKTHAADLFTDIQHLNWYLPSVKTQESSFVAKV